MGTLTEYREDLLKELEGLPSDKIKEVLDFVCFIKARESIDPSQAYFWTNKWQDMEQEADKDKKLGCVIGDGTVDDLLQKLKS